MSEKMTVFYILVMLMSAALFTADMVLRYIEKIRRLGLKKKLIKFKGNTIPYEFFFPHTVTFLLLSLFVFGLTGALIHSSVVAWYLSAPAALIFSMLFCFVLQYSLNSTKNSPPKGGEAAGLEGFALVNIPGDSYGLIEFEYKGRTFQKNAMSEYESDIEKFERVILLFEENDMYAVQSITEVYKILRE